jgi:hypothetical protein
MWRYHQTVREREAPVVMVRMDLHDLHVSEDDIEERVPLDVVSSG